MSYLERLIDRALNEEQENNQIGRYSITPQHGSNCYVYHIYKTIPHKKFFDHKVHLATITIVPNLRVTTEHVSGNINRKESSIIIDTINNLYHNLDLNNETI